MAGFQKEERQAERIKNSVYGIETTAIHMENKIKLDLCLTAHTIPGGLKT